MYVQTRHQIMSFAMPSYLMDKNFKSSLVYWKTLKAPNVCFQRVSFLNVKTTFSFLALNNKEKTSNPKIRPNKLINNSGKIDFCQIWKHISGVNGLHTFTYLFGKVYLSSIRSQYSKPPLCSAFLSIFIKLWNP